MENDELSDEEKQQLLFDSLLTFVRKYILKEENIENLEDNTQEPTCIEVTITSQDGSPMTILVPVRKPSLDAVHCYSSCILEL